MRLACSTVLKILLDNITVFIVKMLALLAHHVSLNDDSRTARNSSLTTQITDTHVQCHYENIGWHCHDNSVVVVNTLTL